MGWQRFNSKFRVIYKKEKKRKQPVACEDDYMAQGLNLGLLSWEGSWTVLYFLGEGGSWNSLGGGGGGGGSCIRLRGGGGGAVLG